MKQYTAWLLAGLACLAHVVPIEASAKGLNLPQGGSIEPASSVGDFGTALLSAVVTANGTLARGAGAAGVQHGLDVPEAQTGYYLVKFNRDVRACAYVASGGFPSATGVPPAGYVATVIAANNTKNIVVETFDSKGNHADLAFHLIVFCDR